MYSYILLLADITSVCVATAAKALFPNGANIPVSSSSHYAVTQPSRAATPSYSGSVARRKG